MAEGGTHPNDQQVLDVQDIRVLRGLSPYPSESNHGYLPV